MKGGRIKKDSSESGTKKNSQEGNICFHYNEEGYWKKDCLKH